MCVYVCECECEYKILTGTPTRKRPLERLRHRWEETIRMDLKGICINTRNWVDSAQDRDYWSALLNAEPPCSISHGPS